MRRIIVDIDGVACDHAKAICNWVNKQYKLNSTPSDVISWDYDFGPITFVEAVKHCYPNKEFILNMGVSQGFKEFYSALNGKVAITFATARTDSKEATQEWISNYFPDNEVVFTPQKSCLSGHDFLIDDYYNECIRCAESGIQCLLIRRPWNSSTQILSEIANYNNITHCASFLEALSIIGIND